MSDKVSDIGVSRRTGTVKIHWKVGDMEYDAEGDAGAVLAGAQQLTEWVNERTTLNRQIAAEMQREATKATMQ